MPNVAKICDLIKNACFKTDLFREACCTEFSCILSRRPGPYASMILIVRYLNCGSSILMPSRATPPQRSTAVGYSRIVSRSFLGFDTEPLPAGHFQAHSSRRASWIDSPASPSDGESDRKGLSAYRIQNSGFCAVC